MHHYLYPPRTAWKTAVFSRWMCFKWHKWMVCIRSVQTLSCGPKGSAQKDSQDKSVLLLKTKITKNNIFLPAQWQTKHELFWWKKVNLIYLFYRNKIVDPKPQMFFCTFFLFSKRQPVCLLVIWAWLRKEKKNSFVYNFFYSNQK